MARREDNRRRTTTPDRSDRSVQVKVAPEFAEYLEEVRDALNDELDLRLGIPDVTRVLLRVRDDPRVIVAIEKRSGRGGRRLAMPVLPDLI